MIMALVYIHRRKDNLKIFYIGISRNDSTNSSSRPYQRAGRNRLWKHIVSQTDYIVEIIHHKIQYEEALLIESQLIMEYGKFIDENGQLTNILDGGEDEWINDSTAKIRSKLKRLYKKHNIPAFNSTTKYIGINNITVKYNTVKPWPITYYDRLNRKEQRESIQYQKKEQQELKKYQKKVPEVRKEILMTKLSPIGARFKQRCLAHQKYTSNW